ncbi:hypothetical protein [Luteolibacter sp. Populi]|uniref:hypothetical protein n=1 Tax=Luteolibacter sp. Populi TaxID=3230487 RepID=UPI003466AB0D
MICRSDVTGSRVEPEWLATLRSQLEARRDPWVLLEGRASVEAALAGWWEVPGVLIAENHAWEVPAWSGMEVLRRPADELAGLGDPERHGGILGVAKMPDETANVAPFIKTLEGDALVVVCPHCTDLGMAGEVVRLALAAGAAAAFFGVEGVSPFEPLAVGVSEGAVFKMPVKITDAGLILRCLMAGKFSLIGLDGGDAGLEEIAKIEGRRALVVPGEGGLGGFWKRACDFRSGAGLGEALERLSAADS